MKKTNPIIRITLGLVSLTASLVLVASTIGIFPDQRPAVISCRKQLSEAMAVSFSSLATRASKESLEKTFQETADRSPDIISVGVRLTDGELLLQIQDHATHWQPMESLSSESQFSVPIYAEDGLYGAIEVRFRPLQQPGLAGYVRSPEFIFVAFLAFSGFGVFYVYLRSVLKQLNPTKAVPKRVREALDTLAEGLLIMDPQERIVLANDAFQQVTGWNEERLLGKPANELPFLARGDEVDEFTSPHPWKATLAHGAEIRGRLLGLNLEAERATTFSVSCSPIRDNQGANRGAIASFEDVTLLEEKKSELLRMVDQLNKSSAEIRQHNRELEVLATRDALTGCYNRRSFFEDFETIWQDAITTNKPLSVLMVDIDHFKSINDTHGHAVGDEVLRRVGQTLADTARDTDKVSRYGGEEFAIFLPETASEEAGCLAESMRYALETLKFEGLSITASLGVSSINQSAATPQVLLEQADKCLYVAKRNGRNRVVNWNHVATDMELKEQEPPEKLADPIEGSSISFHAVTALISALAQRDLASASHCRRVADLCVSIAEGLLPMKDCYVLEIAGLLHDIGRIGVPDDVLFAQEPLTPEQESLLDEYRQMGTNLIETLFACTQLSEIIAHCRTRFEDSNPYDVGSPGLPVGARILCIANAYDNLTHPQTPANALSPDKAFEVLRAQAGDRFDPELVERMIYVVSAQDASQGEWDTTISKDVALRIGLQMERLAAALDARDSANIATIASCLEDTTLRCGAYGIAGKAAEITKMPESDSDLIEVVQLANELLDLCRSSQRALLQVDVPPSACLAT